MILEQVLLDRAGTGRILVRAQPRDVPAHDSLDLREQCVGDRLEDRRAGARLLPQSIVRRPRVVALVRARRPVTTETAGMQRLRERGRQPQKKRRAEPWLAPHGEITAHESRQSAADRQSETGAPVLARERHVGLHERLEDGA